MLEEMNISQQTLGEVVLLYLKGKLDAAASSKVKTAIQELINQGQVKIIVDLAEVSFIDSSGLVALVSGLRLARKHGGNIALSAAQPQPQTVFRLTMFDHIFPIHPTPEEARQGLI